MAERGLLPDAPHVQFAQLYGMSDNLTFNLAEHGYNVSKYLVYGPVKEVLPYLVRRAQENTSVTGEMGRELKLLRTELAPPQRVTALRNTCVPSTGGSHHGGGKPIPRSPKGQPQYLLRYTRR